MASASSPNPDPLALALSRPGAWAEEASVEWVQTHISHVFLVGEQVYKLRKSVRLPFLDFTTRAARNADCLREIELNRRLAPSVYLGVAPLLEEAGAVRVGPVQERLAGPDVEHVVVMRRLAAGHDALSLLERDRLEPAHLEAVAERLERFHAGHGLGRPAPWSAEAWLERTAKPVLACLSALTESDLVPCARIAAVEATLRARLEALRSDFERRRMEGRAVDGHGDVHLEHVWFEGQPTDPLLIDCVEFDDELRRIDSASELAFLAMDLRYREHAELAEWFLAAYASRSDDYGLFAVVDCYAAYRALVRAKVAALATLQPSIAAEQRSRARASVERHFALAESLLEPPGAGSLVLMCGTVGSGKSRVARRLACSGGGIPIASDRVRKRLAGIAPTTRTGAPPDAGLYRPEHTASVYRGLLERAAPVVGAGRTAILDASFARRAQREEVRSWATQRQIPVRLVEVRCDPEIARERLAERSRAGLDPSDAGPDFLPISRARFEPPDEWPAAAREVIRTDPDGRPNEAPS